MEYEWRMHQRHFEGTKITACTKLSGILAFVEHVSPQYNKMIFAKIYF